MALSGGREIVSRISEPESGGRPAMTSSGASGSRERSRAYARNSPGTFFLRSKLPMYRIGPEECVPARGLQEGAPGGQRTIRSGATPSFEIASRAVYSEMTTTASARRAWMADRAG